MLLWPLPSPQSLANYSRYQPSSYRLISPFSPLKDSPFSPLKVMPSNFENPPPWETDPFYTSHDCVYLFHLLISLALRKIDQTYPISSNNSSSPKEITIFSCSCFQSQYYQFLWHFIVELIKMSIPHCIYFVTLQFTFLPVFNANLDRFPSSSSLL